MDKSKMNEAVCKVLKRLHYPIEVMLVCVRWYAAYPLSLRQIEEMMAERGVAVDHATIHRWAIKMIAGSGLHPRTAQAPGRHELADGRNVHQGQRRVEVPVPCGRPRRPDD